MAAYIYGLENSNHDFKKEESFGKNIVTNAFPISFSMYLAQVLKKDPGWVEVVKGDDDGLTINHTTKPLDELIGIEPDRAHWDFESKYELYDSFATNQVKKSDVVVLGDDNKHLSAFEIKLTVIPTSSTADKPREKQNCEIVVRPGTIEQLSYSILAGFSDSKKDEIKNVLVSHLDDYVNFEWDSEQFMINRVDSLFEAVSQIASKGIDKQRPFLIQAIWRTIKSTSKLDSEAFDVQFWSDRAFLILLLNCAKKSQAGKKTISRATRALIWFTKALLDYYDQKQVSFEKITSNIIFNSQTDKAFSLSNATSWDLVKCDILLHPRIHKEAFMEIINKQGIMFLSPERRLDSAIMHAFVTQCIGN